MPMFARIKGIAQSKRGFTMIELLVVITILGILAVAVLSAINPIEQINRGRDTASRSDAEQLLSAFERYNAFQGYYPWQEDANDDAGIAINPIEPFAETSNFYTIPNDDSSNNCTVGDRLTIGLGISEPTCIGAQEVKESFIDRLMNSPSARQLYVYTRGQQGDSTYICFVPQSGAFLQEAQTRCDAGLPGDIDSAVETEICTAERMVGTATIAERGVALCLP